ncbi:MAG: Na+/H+ antiporter subunit E [Planctomycetota bacterium]
MRSILLFLTLLGFWLLLSGQFDSPFLITSGVLASVLTVFICRRLDLIGSQYQPFESLLGFLLYLPWLLVQIVKASLDVTWKCWSPRPAIAPRLVEVPSQLEHPLAKTLLANSITLTPGTVTIDVRENTLLVHALSERAQRGVLEGKMEQRIARLVPEDPQAVDQQEETR